MAQHYSDPSRASDTHSLPDIEVWQDVILTVSTHCGEFDIAAGSGGEVACPSCETVECVKEVKGNNEFRLGWFWWYCFPGCLPETGANGPYASEQHALNAAREEGGYDNDDDE